jgi:hypothetical protein
MDTIDRATTLPHGFARQALAAILLTAAGLAGLPAVASATEVRASQSEGTQESPDNYLRVRGDDGESNAIEVDGERVTDRKADIRDASDPDERCSRRSARELRCPSHDYLTIDAKDSDDTITVDLSGSGPGNAWITPGNGRDRVRLVFSGTSNRNADVFLRDGEADQVTCEGGRRGVVRVQNRDPEDRVTDCPGAGGSPAPPASGPAPQRLDFYSRRVHGRAGVLRRGLRATCSATAAGSCSVTGSISRTSARSLGIRTRARRFVILRGSTPISGRGANVVQVQPSRRARAALRGRRVRGLRVLLTATLRDGAGNRDVNRFAVTLRG